MNEIEKKKQEELKKVDQKSFVRKFKKSYDFRDHGVGISVVDQTAAEETASPSLMALLKENALNSPVDSVTTIALVKGELTLSKKDSNLFNGFFKDTEGQIIEKFDDKTLELVAKALMVKNLYVEPVEYEVQPEEIEVPTSAPEEAKTFIKVRFGDFELEMRKSLQGALDKSSDRESLKKSLQIFRKSASGYTNLKDDKSTIRELLENWDIHSERFNQIIFAVDQVKKAKK